MKYTHFPVNQKWVIELWQLRKLSHIDAKEEIVGPRGHTKSYLFEINFVRKIEEEHRVLVQQQEDRKSPSQYVKPFRTVLDVELWKLQFKADDGGRPAATRFKFLVLNGPGCLGKTQFAKHLFGEDQCLLVPCQGVKQPCLKEFNRTVHKCVVFDELNSKAIVDNKALFQSNTDGVLLGQSACNEHAYWRYLYAVPLVVSCNDWLEGKLEDHEKEWLQANAIVYEVKEKLWLEHGEADVTVDIEV